MALHPRNPSPRPRRLRRLICGVLGLGLFAAGPLSSGCAPGFDPPSKLNSLRVLAVVADNPYPQPGDEVTFQMEYFDGYRDENVTAPRNVQITWLGGCFSPEGDQYFACYDQLETLFTQVAAGEIPPDGLIAQGTNLTEFTLQIPDDIISRRPPPDNGPYVGTAFVFFTVCAGEIRPVEPEGTGEAGSFPLGCFDSDGNRLGPESFVPGFTQLFSFDDGRTNENPVVNGMTFDGEEWSTDINEVPRVKLCPLTEEERKQTGCGAPSQDVDCDEYTIKVQVPSDVAEIDPGEGSDGESLDEVVFVNYHAQAGEMSSDVKLINDAVEGYTDGFETEWTPPDEPGTYTIWAVVRDNRGGSAVIERLVQVEE